MNLSYLFRRLMSALDPRRYTATKCGHRTRRSGAVSAFGRTIHTQMPLNAGTVDYCLDCIGKMTIRCTWCGEPIFIDDPVTLHSPAEPDFKIPEHAVVYDEKLMQLVGCLGWDCADTGADQAGFWLPGGDGKGHVYRVPTVYDMAIAGDKPCAAIVNDLSDATERPTLMSVD